MLGRPDFYDSLINRLVLNVRLYTLLHVLLLHGRRRKDGAEEEAGYHLLLMQSGDAILSPTCLRLAVAVVPSSRPTHGTEISIRCSDQSLVCLMGEQKFPRKRECIGFLPLDPVIRNTASKLNALSLHHFPRRREPDNGFPR